MPYPGPRLGNFNYDIARSAQTYNVPIYGLEQGQSVEITINQMAESTITGLELMNITAHHGHGNATAEDCNNEGVFQFEHDQGHLGLLEYVSFNLCDSACMMAPTNTTNNYCFNVPSSWDSFITV